MRPRLTLFLPLVVLLGRIMLAQFVDSSAAPNLTPAELSIRGAEEALAKHSDQSLNYNALAMALARRARETSHVRYYAEAEEALQKSFKLAPQNFEALKVQAWLLLGRHEFAKALELATRLNRQVPDDLTVYGYLADANAELGNYDAAENAAQWMLDLRPGNIAGLTRGAYLRELYGNLPGAIELMKLAYDATSFQEFEDRAWTLTQIAHLYLISGDLQKAETHAKEALELFPNYHYALGMLGQIRVAQRRYAEACDLFRQRYTEAPHAEHVSALAEALTLAGRRSEAQKLFSEFEQKALKESSLPDNANLELIAYYIDHAAKPQTALDLAKQEISRRHDVYTLDAYAWALAANGDYQSANKEIERALSVGVKDPKLLYHAGSISLHLNDLSKARTYLKDAETRYSLEASKVLESFPALQASNQ
jgi:tetratricopeptide (TPR) repeat protein